MTPRSVARFWTFVRVTPLVTGCWSWTGHVDDGGYGVVMLDGKTCKAHRVGYELCVGSIPPGLVIDHLCRNRSCVRPDHLEPVTVTENIRRGVAGRVNNRSSEKTHCPAGHPYSPENTRRNRLGRRFCRTCARQHARARYHAKKGGGDATGVRSHCPHGHEYTPENTYKRRSGRSCRECMRISLRRNRRKQRAFRKHHEVNTNV